MLSGRSIFVNKDGTVKQEGDIMKRPLLAQTLRRIAEDPHTFYDGSLARDVASDLQERGIVSLFSVTVCSVSYCVVMCDI